MSRGYYKYVSKEHSTIVRSAYTVYLCVFFMDLRTNRDYFPIQHQLDGFYYRDREDLLRGTDLTLRLPN
jgi:hypothetical protein